MQKNPQNQNGFSIIEVLIAIFIIGIMLVFYAASSNTLLLNGNARHLELAQRIAISQMENLRALDIAALPASGTFTNALISGLPGGSGNILVSDVNASTKQVVVTVSWNEPGGNSARSVSFTTIKTQNGLQ